MLIAWGRAGGVLREAVKHSSVESVVQCEIDENVIQVSKKFLPVTAVGYSSSKLTLYVDDGSEFMKQNWSAFDVVGYAYCTIPTYPSGQIGFVLCSKNPSTKFLEPMQQLMQKLVEQMQLKYYNSDVHWAAFVLPEFARKALSDLC
ncbi:Spermidine synthase [Camelus dromedarius]|uniref:Spermidine synthase n=1 Tax=Camelus dromedarius TaxID=9838 RepID=A0A5N4C193_CAMDR|nr:Spermidine synthase [Camelus dromedarius]